MTTSYPLLAALTGLTDKAPQMALHRGGGTVTVRTWLEKWLMTHLGELKKPEVPADSDGPGTPEKSKDHWVQPNDLTDRLVDRAVAFLKEAAVRLQERVTARENTTCHRVLKPWTDSDLEGVVVLSKVRPSGAARSVIDVLKTLPLQGLSEATMGVFKRLAVLVLAVVNVLDNQTPCPPKGTMLSVVRQSLCAAFPWLRQRLTLFPGLAGLPD